MGEGATDRKAKDNFPHWRKHVFSFFVNSECGIAEWILHKFSFRQSLRKENAVKALEKCALEVPYNFNFSDFA